MKTVCGTILSENFNLQILGDDQILIDKYRKFLEKKKLIENNTKIKLCSFPDSQGYAELFQKSNKYVKYNFGHEFCFNCLNKPHGE